MLKLLVPDLVGELDCINVCEYMFQGLYFSEQNHNKFAEGILEEKFSLSLESSTSNLPSFRSICFWRTTQGLLWNSGQIFPYMLFKLGKESRRRRYSRNFTLFLIVVPQATSPAFSYPLWLSFDSFFFHPVRAVLFFEHTPGYSFAAELAGHASENQP